MRVIPQHIRPLSFREGKGRYALAFILSDSISPPMDQFSPAVSVMITWTDSAEGVPAMLTMASVIALTRSDFCDSLRLAASLL